MICQLFHWISQKDYMLKHYIDENVCPYREKETSLMDILYTLCIYRYIDCQVFYKQRNRHLLSFQLNCLASFFPIGRLTAALGDFHCYQPEALYTLEICLCVTALKTPLHHFQC